MKYITYLPLQLLVEINYTLRFFKLKPDKYYWADVLLAKQGFSKRLGLIIRFDLFVRGY